VKAQSNEEVKTVDAQATPRQQERDTREKKEKETEWVGVGHDASVKMCM